MSRIYAQPAEILPPLMQPPAQQQIPTSPDAAISQLPGQGVRPAAHNNGSSTVHRTEHTFRDVTLPIILYVMSLILTASAIVLSTYDTVKLTREYPDKYYVYLLFSQSGLLFISLVLTAVVLPCHTWRRKVWYISIAKLDYTRGTTTALAAYIACLAVLFPAMFSAQFDGKNKQDAIIRLVVIMVQTSTDLPSVWKSVRTLRSEYFNGQNERKLGWLVARICCCPEFWYPVVLLVLAILFLFATLVMAIVWLDGGSFTPPLPPLPPAPPPPRPPPPRPDLTRLGSVHGSLFSVTQKSDRDRWDQDGELCSVAFGPRNQSRPGYLGAVQLRYGSSFFASSSHGLTNAPSWYFLEGSRNSSFLKLRSDEYFTKVSVLADTIGIFGLIMYTNNSSRIITYPAYLASRLQDLVWDGALPPESHFECQDLASRIMQGIYNACMG